MEFRPLNINDDNEIQLIAEIDAYLPFEYDPDYKLDTDSVYDCYLRLKKYFQDYPTYIFILGWDQNQIVAAHFVIMKEQKKKKIASVLITWVHKDYRGKGLAKKMKIDGEAWAKKHGAEEMSTHVHQNNQKMYEINLKAGYKPLFINLTKKI